MINFVHPEYLALIFATLLAIIFRFMIYKKTTLIEKSFDVWNGSGFYYKAFFRNAISKSGSVLFFASVCALIFALSEPEFLRKEIIFTERGDDIMFVLDSSPSMAAQDFTGSRFEKARSLLYSFVKSRPETSFGLVVLGREASLKVPPTKDHETFFTILDSVAIAEEGDGTALGLGIATAVHHLLYSKAPKKYVIVLTDGENNSGEISPLDAARLSANEGCEFFIIGIGKDGEFPIEYDDPETQKHISGTYRSHYSKESMQTIARLANGTYLSAEDSTSLTKVFDELNRISRREIMTKTISSTDSRTEYCILIALICLLLGLFLKRFVAKDLI